MEPSSKNPIKGLSVKIVALEQGLLDYAFKRRRIRHSDHFHVIDLGCIRAVLQRAEIRADPAEPHIRNSLSDLYSLGSEIFTEIMGACVGSEFVGKFLRLGLAINSEGTSHLRIRGELRREQFAIYYLRN